MAGILLCRVCISDYVRWLCLLFKTTTTTKLRCITVESFQSEWMNIWMRWKRTWCICIFYRFFEVTYEVDSRILSFEFIFDRKIERFKPQKIDLKNTLCEEEIHFFKYVWIELQVCSFRVEIPVERKCGREAWFCRSKHEFEWNSTENEYSFDMVNQLCVSAVEIKTFGAQFKSRNFLFNRHWHTRGVFWLEIRWNYIIFRYESSRRSKWTLSKKKIETKK